MANVLQKLWEAKKVFVLIFLFFLLQYGGLLDNKFHRFLLL